MSEIGSEKQSGTSRRKFIGGSTAVAAGTIASTFPAKSYGEVAGGSTLKVALIGCGGRGTGAANQTLKNEGVKLVAMADAFKKNLDDKLASLKKNHPDKVDVPEDRRFVGFDAYKDAIAAADVVILTTPPGFRPIHFEAAVKAGKHIFMEKPVGVDAPGIRKVLEMAKEADKKGLKVVVGLQRHYQNSYLETLERYKNGMIGDFVSAQCYWNGAGVWVRKRKPQQTEMEYQVDNWYYFNWLCGDHITEQHVHNIDVVNWFKGEHPVSAQGMGGREVRHGKEYGEIFDHHYVEFTYADGTKLNSQCRHQPGCWNQVSETIVGTKGVAKPGLITDHRGQELWRHRGKGDPNPYQVEHDHLYDAIRNDKPLNNAYYGATSTFSSILGRYATYSGKVMKWDEAIQADNSLLPDSFSWDAKPKLLPNEDGLYPVAIPGKTNVLG